MNAPTSMKIAVRTVMKSPGNPGNGPISEPIGAAGAGDGREGQPNIA